MSATTKKDYSGKTVLAVDNDKKALTGLRDALASMGFEVVTAVTAAAAEALIQEKKFDLMITEILLEFPDSGFVLCYRMKKQQPECKVLILTNAAARTGLSFDLSSPDSRDWIKADILLNKNIRHEQLEAAMTKLFG